MTKTQNTPAAQTATCTECGRILRSEASITRGTGPVCAARKTAATALSTAFKDPETAATKALQVIADKAIVRTRTQGQYLVVASHGDQSYLTDVEEGSCTCKAGARHGRCSHLLAANIIEITATRRTAIYALAA
jgi:hypothetical protein